VKRALISDIHSNLEGLQAVLDDARQQGVDEVICLGDVVGYGPQPLECAEELLALKSLTIVMGNHDAALAGKMDIKWFNANAVWAIEFARKNMAGRELAYVAGLPERVDNPEFTLVHGSPRKPLTEYMLSELQFADNAEAWTVSPCFIGHSHMPLYFREKPDSLPETDFLKPLTKISLASGRTMLNPGSVGQPRDGDPRAACGIYDTEKKTFELYRVFYDVDATQRLMSELRMPALLSERLSFGF